MKTLADFYRSLKVGDVITTVGCKGQPKNKEEPLIPPENQTFASDKWRRYARVAEVLSEDVQLKEGHVGVRLEGIYPSIKEVMWHATNTKSKSAACVRKATETEHQVFMEEYLKTRVAIVDHRMNEIKQEQKSLRRERARLSKIAETEDIDADKLVSSPK